MKRSRLIEMSYWYPETGRVDWFKIPLDESEDELEHLKHYQNKNMLDMMQYCEDNIWRYYKNDELFYTCRRVRIKKL